MLKFGSAFEDLQNKLHMIEAIFWWLSFLSFTVSTSFLIIYIFLSGITYSQYFVGMMLEKCLQLDQREFYQDLKLIW